MREKLLRLMQSEGLTSSRLAELLEAQPSSISHLLSGRNKPGFDLLQKILRRFPKINPDWLLLDDEKMYRVDVAEAPIPGQFFPDNEPVVSVAASSRGESSGNESGQQPAPISASGFPARNANDSRVRRVILLYEDGTCENFNARS